MVCKHHPNTTLQWQEVKSRTTHPFTGEEIYTFQDVEYCPDCFEQAAITGIWKHDLLPTEKEQLENDICKYIENKV